MLVNFPVRILKIHWGTFEKIDFENVKNSKIQNFKVDFHQNAKFQVEFFSFKSEVRTLKEPCKTKNRFGTHLKLLLKKFENHQFSKKKFFWTTLIFQILKEKLFCNTRILKYRS